LKNVRWVSWKLIHRSFRGPLTHKVKLKKNEKKTRNYIYGHCQALPIPTIVQRQGVFEHRDCIKTFSPGESLATQGFVQEPFRIPTTCTWKIWNRKSPKMLNFSCWGHSSPPGCAPQCK
jgi:hypothetical protein